MCPNCGRQLAYPLSQCRGGRCPFCHYKPGDLDLHVNRRKPREPRDVPRDYKPGDWDLHADPRKPPEPRDLPRRESQSYRAGDPIVDHKKNAPPPDPDDLIPELPWWVKPLVCISFMKDPRFSSETEEIEWQIRRRIKRIQSKPRSDQTPASYLKKAGIPKKALKSPKGRATRKDAKLSPLRKRK